MKKIIFFSLIISTALGFTACSGEEDDLFDASAAERLNAAASVYSARLMAQPNGWAMQLYPTYDNEAPNGKGYLLLTRFKKDYTVDVCGYVWPYWQEDQVGAAGSSETEWRVHYKNEYSESTAAWEIITDNGPVLSFNDYNTNMHYFSDPDFRSADTEHGTGFGGDYEFIIVDAPEDASYMMLKGKKRGTYNLLTPIEVGVVYEEYMADVTNFHSWLFAENAPTFNVVHFGDSIYKMENAHDGLPNIYPYDGDAIANESFNPFLITKRGNDYYLRFRDARTVGNVTVQDFIYNKERDILESVEHPDFFIGGDTIARFFVDAMQQNKVWSMGRGSDMSESMATLYSNMSTEFKSKKYTLSSVSFSNDPNGVPGLRVTYKNSSNKAASMFYYINFVRNGETVSLEMQPLEDEGGAKKLMDMFPTMNSFMSVVCREFKGMAVDTQFNLSTIKLVSTANDADWFIFTLR